MNFAPSVLNELPRVDLAALTEHVPLDGIVLEVAEEAPIDHYARLGEALTDIRRCGTRLAIDASAPASPTCGTSSSCDRTSQDGHQLVRDIDTDCSRRVLASSIARCGRQTGASVVAERIETPAELGALLELGVPYEQGYLRGRLWQRHKPCSRMDSNALFLEGKRLQKSDLKESATRFTQK